MSMQTFVLSEETAGTALEAVLKQSAGCGLEIRNTDGKVLGYLLPPDNEEAWAYAEAGMYIANHRDELMAAKERRADVTTKELSERAERAEKVHDFAKIELKSRQDGIPVEFRRLVDDLNRFARTINVSTVSKRIEERASRVVCRSRCTPPSFLSACRFDQLSIRGHFDRDTGRFPSKA